MSAGNTFMDFAFPSTRVPVIDDVEWRMDVSRPEETYAHEQNNELYIFFKYINKLYKIGLLWFVRRGWEDRLEYVGIPTEVSRLYLRLIVLF